MSDFDAFIMAILVCSRFNSVVHDPLILCTLVPISDPNRIFVFCSIV